MSWSFVGSVTTDTPGGGGATTETVHLPSGVQGGDLVVVVFCMTGSGATATVSIPGFTTLENSGGGAKPTGSFSDNFAVMVKPAGGSPGSATTDTTYTATFNETAFGESITFVLRTTSGGWAVVGHAEYNGNASGTYSATAPDASYTPTSSSNATVWGYAGQNSALATTGSTFSGTGPSALSNFVGANQTANGGGIGMGWIQSTSAPGGATANQAIDATDFAAEFIETIASGPNSPSTGTDKADGTGSWTNPGNITADDGSAAVWTVV